LINKGQIESGVIKNDRAQMLEETRKKYEEDLSKIFNQIEEENQRIGELVDHFNDQSLAKSTNQIRKYLDYPRWRTHIMDRFKKVAIKK
jgi:hypothetical protein